MAVFVTSGVIEVTLGGIDAIPATMELVWNESAPYEVQIVFTEPNGTEVPWVAERGLILSGMHSYLWAGRGDIRVRRSGALDMEIRLDPPDGQQLVSGIPVDAVEEFLAGTALSDDMRDAAMTAMVDECIALALG